MAASASCGLCLGKAEEETPQCPLCVVSGIGVSLPGRVKGQGSNNTAPEEDIDMALQPVSAEPCLLL